MIQKISPEGTTFECKDKDNNPVDTKTPGDKDVVVVAKLNGEPIAEIPAKVTVVSPKTQYVFENDPSKDITPEEDIDPKTIHPEGTKFTYKDGEVDTKNNRR